jgi:integrase/recombinase XerC
MQVKLFGKARKERICRPWPETAELLTALLKRQPRPDDEPIFLNRYGQLRRAAGVRFNLQRYVRCAAEEIPSLKDKHVLPHPLKLWRLRESRGGSVTALRGLWGNRARRA